MTKYVKKSVAPIISWANERVMYQNDSVGFFTSYKLSLIVKAMSFVWIKSGIKLKYMKKQKYSILLLSLVVFVWEELLELNL